MKEGTFLKKNQARWKQLESTLELRNKVHPDELSSLFIQLTDDLSYARTYYPDSKTTQYLNFLSTRLHHEIYKNKKERKNRFVRFWTSEVPLAVGKHLNILALAFIVFEIGFILGWITQANDSDFVRITLSSEYVQMTLENMEAGKPMDVYDQETEVLMFLQIMFNNIKVSMVYFLLGFLAGIGTFWRIFSESLRIGSFLSFFHQNNLQTEALLSVWMHGTIEISVIIVAGMAGMVLGKGFLFPGSYARMDSFRRHAMDGLKIIIGLVPFFILAAFIEGYLTRLAPQNPVLSISVILLSLSLIVSYFVILPILVKQKLNRQTPDFYVFDTNRVKKAFQWSSLEWILGFVSGALLIAIISLMSQWLPLLFGIPVLFGILLYSYIINQRKPVHELDSSN